MNDETRPLPKGDLLLSSVIQQADLNPWGDVSGGKLVEKMDIATQQLARRTTQGPVATMTVGDMSFVRPLFPGNSLFIYGKVESIGRSSIRVSAEIWGRKLDSEQEFKVAESNITFIAIDEFRRVREIKSQPNEERTYA